jgi:cytochrome c-type biogenesis protein CcmH/NrfG
MSALGSALALLLLTTAVWAQPSTSPAAKSAAATLKRDFERCRTYSNLDACDDAIRWNPSDPALLVAQGDALLKAKRPADAIRAYRRAATLAPNLGGMDARIGAAQAKLAAAHAPRARPTATAAASKRYSNAAPESQSH